MTANIVQLRTVMTDDASGGCPECGEADSYLSIGNANYAACSAHRTIWIPGDYAKECRAEIAARWPWLMSVLTNLRQVEPVTPQVEECHRCRARTTRYRSAAESEPHHPLCSLAQLSDADVRAAIDHIRQYEGGQCSDIPF